MPNGLGEQLNSSVREGVVDWYIENFQWAGSVVQVLLYAPERGLRLFVLCSVPTAGKLQGSGPRVGEGGGWFEFRAFASCSHPVWGGTPPNQ